MASDEDADKRPSDAFLRLLRRDDLFALAPVDVARLYLLHTNISTAMFDLLFLLTKVAGNERITLLDLKEVNDAIMRLRRENDEWLQIITERLDDG